MLFTDVSGFTAMSESRDPEEVTGIMNAFFAVLTRAIYRYGGTVDKYIGDAIMALFGAPVAHEDDAERAVSAAWDMQTAAAEFAADLEQRTGIALRIRIGINTGLVVAGAVGGQQKRDYTVLGDAVNLASRLESNCRPGHILVSSETQRLARRTFFFSQLEPIKVKGKAEPVSAFEVSGPRAQLPDGEERPHFSGRRQELELLRQALGKLAGGSSQVSLLVGEAGIGKSRLAHEFEKHAEQSGAIVLKARCFSYQAQTPYALLSALLAAGLGIGAHTPELARLCAAASVAEPQLAAEALCHVLGRPLADATLVSFTPEQLRAFVNRTVNALIRHRAASAPVILSLVDLHWLDSASGDWLQAAIAEFAALPARVFFLLQLRPEGESELVLPASCQRLRLAPLSAPDGQAIVASFLEGPADEGAARILTEALERAEGNPFYLCEILRTLTEQGVLVRQGDLWIASNAAAPVLPATIHGAVAARVDILPQAAKQTLQVASVIGRRSPKTLLASLLEDDHIEARIAELVAAELAHLGADGQVVFNQALIQEVVYQGLLVKTRKGLHLDVGLALEGLSDDPEAIAPELALHFERGEDDAKSSQYLHISARRSVERFANAEAAVALRGAIAALDRLAGSPLPTRAATPESVSPGDLPCRPELLLMLGDAERALGRYDAAQAAYGEALQEAAGDLQADVHQARGSAFDQQGDYAAAAASYEQALAAATDPRTRGTTLGLLAHIAYRQANYPAAITHCRTAIALLDLQSHPQAIAKAESVLGLCHWRKGELDEADVHHRRALALRESCRDVYGIGASLTNLAQIGSELGRWRQALGLAEQALAIYERTGDPQRICSGAMVVGGLEMDLGEFAAAERQLRRSLEQARRIGHPLSTALSLANLGDLATRQGRPQDAIADLEEAAGILDHLGGKGHLAQALLLLGTALTLVGREADAWQALRRGLELAEATGEKATIGAACHRISRFYLAAGRPSEALPWAGKGVSILQEAGYQQELGHGYMQLAEVFAAQGRLESRDEARQRAVAIFESIGAEYEARRARDLFTCT